MKLNPLSLFDYVFFRVASFYRNSFGDEDYWYAIFILSIIQCMNLLTFISLVFILLNKTNKLPPLLMIVPCVILFITFNFIRYYRVIKYQDLMITWGQEETSIKTKRGLYIILYFILSIILSVFLLNLATATTP